MGSGSLLRDRSKSIGGGPEQRGGESSVFEPLVRGESFNFQLPMGVGHPVFKEELAHI